MLLLLFVAVAAAAVAVAVAVAAVAAVAVVAVVAAHRLFAIYLIMLGWNTYTLVHVIMKPTIPNPRPTQPKKIRLKVALRPLFSPQQIIFRGLGLVLHRKQNYKKPNPNKYPPPTPYCAR